MRSVPRWGPSRAAGLTSNGVHSQDGSLAVDSPRSPSKPNALALVERMLDERVIYGVFVALIVLMAVRHEPWRDEWQAWVIARDSASLGDVLTNTQYEGHPALWYFVLWIASRVSRDVLAMQLVNVAIASVTAAVVLWRAPFSRFVRVALIFGYFPFYEYGTIARSYGLGLMLLVIVCAVASSRPRRPIPIAVLLGLMMLTSAHALLVAVAIGTALLCDAAFERWQTRQALRPSPQLVAAVLIVIAAGLWAVAQISPPADGGYGVGLSTPADARSALPPFDQVAVAALILRRVFMEQSILHALAYALGVLIVVAVAWRFRRRPAAIVLWTSGVGLLLGLAWLRFVGTTRHIGHLYMLGLAAFWLEGSFAEMRSTTQLARKPSQRLVPAAVAVILSAHLLFSARASAKDLLLPYSPTPAAAKWIRDNGLANAPLIGYPGEVAMTVGAHLDRPMLFPEQDRTGTFVLWRNDRRQLSDSEIISAARQLLDDVPQVVVVVRDPLEGDLGPLRLGGSFTDGIVSGEWIHVYVGSADPQDGDGR